jgi:peptidoglycan/xylan/chitin deacetylase (PgdA/CDA1 family)
MLHIIWNKSRAEAVWRQGRTVYTTYLFELLRQAGLAYEVWTPADWRVRRPAGVTLVAGLDDADDWAEQFQAYCEDGNALLAVGNTYGLDTVLGVESVRGIKEGWIEWGDAPLGEGLHGSFHFFGAALVEATDGVEAQGSIRLKNGTLTGHPAVTFRRLNRGAAALLGIDLPRTFVMIQQGVAVVKDGVPADDGTGALDDDIFKTDDASVLDWRRDRKSVGDGAPFYLDPIVDEFRLVLLRLVYRLREAAARPFAQVWFWPDGLEAVGHISHDSDGNLVDAAETLLNRLKEADIRSSWCVIAPPGYPRGVYERIIGDGHEVALHYHALELEGRYWDESLFQEQLQQLVGQLDAIGRPVRIVTNKNHYLRWEGDVQFYEWCERVGIVVEQSKGGTKQGNKGFTFGTCHPYLPVSGAAERNRVMNVYNVPTLAWDPPTPVRCTMPEAKAILDRCKDVYGVAHFLFHPSMLMQVPEVGPGLVELVRYGKAQGLAWWTAVELYEWLALRRTVEVSVEDDALRISAGRECRGLTLLLSPDVVPVAEETGANVRGVTSVVRYGLALRQWIVDVPAGETVVPLHRQTAGTQR